MIEAIKIWNEPNNLSHWDATIDPEWKEFSVMAALAAQTIRECAPEVSLVLGGISPIDQGFISLLSGYDLLKHFDAVAVHGFPLDWNYRQIDEWPKKIEDEVVERYVVTKKSAIRPGRPLPDLSK